MLASGVFGFIGDYLLWWVLFISLVVHTWCFFKFFPRARRRKSGLVFGNALVFLCMLGVAGLAGETYFRFLCVETDSFGLSLPAHRWFALYTRLNSLACRDDEWSMEKPPGVRRIAFVGDSFTYGWGIERVEDRFPDRIQARFDETEPGSVQVMNVAKAGWGTGGQIQPIRDMIDLYGVDEVVLCYVLNDIERLVPRTGDFDPLRPPEPRWFNPDVSCLLDYLHRRIAVPRASTVAGYFDWLAAGFAEPAIWRAHQEQLHEIIRQCRERDVVLRVALLPYVRTRGHRFQPRRLHAMLRDFFEVNSVEVVDLLSVTEGLDPADLVVSKLDPHPNEHANELFANEIWQGFYAQATP